VGSVALAIAVAVKLTRVVMLAPLLAIVGLAERRRATAAAKTSTEPQAARPPLVPLFVIGFLALAALRSTGVLPGPVLNVAVYIDGLLLAAGMFALGTAVRLRELFRSGLPLAAL